MRKNDLLSGVLALNSAWMVAIRHYLSFFLRMLNKNSAWFDRTGCDFKFKRIQINLADQKMSGKDVY